MKLLFYLTRYPGWGGIENVTSLIIDELLLRGYEIDIISHIQQYEAQTIPPSVTLYKTPDNTALDTPQNREYAESVLKMKSYDLIIYQDCYAPNEDLIISLSRKSKVRFIVFEHNTPLLLYKVKFLSNKPIKRFIQNLIYPILRQRLLNKERFRKRRLYDNCERYIMLSSHYIPEIAKQIRVSLKQPNKFRSIPNPNFSDSMVQSQKRKELLYVGRLVPENQVDKILEIWKKLEVEFPDWSLLVVGDGPLRPDLELKVDEENISRVSFLGFQKPQEFYSRAQILLMTSKFEGWGLTLLEAMSHECVPIAENNFSAIVDIIDDGINGVIIPGGAKVEYWVRRLSDLMDNPCILSEMKKKGKEKVKEFDVSEVVNQWEILFRTLE